MSLVGPVLGPSGHVKIVATLPTGTAGSNPTHSATGVRTTASVRASAKGSSGNNAESVRVSLGHPDERDSALQM